MPHLRNSGSYETQNLLENEYDTFIIYTEKEMYV